MEKIIFQVVEVNGEKLFQVSAKKKTLFLNKILSVWFEGYYRCTKCQLLRNNEPYDDGYVNYYGTHRASDYFFGFKLIATEQMIREISSETLELGDIVEVENTMKLNCQSYTSVSKFINQVLHFQKFSQSFQEAFIANDGKLSGKEFIDALISCSSGVSWQDRMKTVQIVRL